MHFKRYFKMTNMFVLLILLMMGGGKRRPKPPPLPPPIPPPPPPPEEPLIPPVLGGPLSELIRQSRSNSKAESKTSTEDKEPE